MSGLRILFDPSLDGPGWPGPAATGACFGELWLGFMGLIERLELELGLGGVAPGHGQRACQLVRALDGDHGFWRRSFDADPLATCRRLLSDRDELCLWGWQGQPVSPRLRELWRVTAGALPGIPDRIRAIMAALGHQRTAIERIEIFEGVDALPPLWRALLGALESSGVVISLRAAQPAGQGKGQRPEQAAHRGSDGQGALHVLAERITLLRAQGPLAAADELAAALAAMAELDGAVVIGGDAIVDAALARHGLPRVGGAAEAAASQSLARLVLEAAYAPMDPRVLHALLCASPGPVPVSAARRLARAMQSSPGRGSSAWHEAMDEALERVPEERREALGKRLRALLEPALRRGEAMSIEPLRERLSVLTQWARGRVDELPTLAGALAQAEELIGLVETLGTDSVTPTLLWRLCDEVETRDRTLPGEARLARVSSPGAILGPARVVMWWGFTRSNAPSIRPLRLSARERQALRDAGVTPPDASLMMAAEARRWRRPVAAAAESLILVCPLRDEAGEANFLHPLWDDLVQAIPGVTGVHRLERKELVSPARRIATLRSLPSPATDVVVPPVRMREVESPSSLEMLLGCSLRWALHYHGRVRPGLASGAPTATPLLFGTLSHHFLELVFAGDDAGSLSPNEAASRAAHVFEDQCPRLCELLELPSNQHARSMVKRAVVETAREIALLMKETGSSLEGMEVPVRGHVGAVELQGYVDLLLRSPDVVVDLKWGEKSYREKLERGTALQLAAYAELARQGPDRPEVAYLSMGSQKRLAEAGASIPGAETPGPHRALDTWRGAVAAFETRRAELDRGVLVAPGAAGDAIEIDDGLGEDGTLRLGPGCRTCNLGALCGRKGAQ